MLVKILGALDLISAIVFLMLIFGFNVIFQIVLFCALLLFLKGLFILNGEILSVIDLAAAVLLILSLFFDLYAFLLWIPAFLLMAKGIVSFT